MTPLESCDEQQLTEERQDDLSFDFGEVYQRETCKMLIQIKPEKFPEENCQQLFLVCSVTEMNYFSLHSTVLYFNVSATILHRPPQWIEFWSNELRLKTKKHAALVIYAQQ